MHVFVDESMNAISSNLVEKRSGKPSLIVPLFQYSGVWCLFDLKKSPLLKGLISRFLNHACSYIKAYILTRLILLCLIASSGFHLLLGSVGLQTHVLPVF